MNDLIITALRNKYRYQTMVGLISTEDLYHIGQDIRSVLYNDLKTEEEKKKGKYQLRKSKNTKDIVLKNKIKIVEYIDEMLEKEEEDRKASRSVDEHNQNIMRKIAQKKDDELDKLDIDELEKLLIK